MLYQGTVKKINRDTLSTTRVRLFNTQRTTELYADSTDAIFHYTKNILDRREKSDEYKIDETKATVDAFWGGDDQELSLAVLKKKIDGKGGAISFEKTITLGLNQIAFGWEDPDDATKCWIEVYPSAFKKIEYQVDLPLAALEGLSAFWTFNFLDADNAALSVDVTGTIDLAAKTVALTVPVATVVTALVASFTTSTGASVLVGATPQVSGTTANDYTSPVDFIVNSADGHSTSTYTVTVTIAT